MKNNFYLIRKNDKNILQKERKISKIFEKV